MDWHYGAPLRETLRKVGLDSSMSPRTNDLASHTTEMQQTVILNETFQNQANDRTTNSLHSENTTPKANIPKANHGLYPAVTGRKINTDAVPFVPTVNNTTSTIGQDLWRQLNCVQIPVFSGEKRHYQSWKAAFLACTNSAPATEEYKLLQLRQYL